MRTACEGGRGALRADASAHATLGQQAFLHYERALAFDKATTTMYLVCTKCIRRRRDQRTTINSTLTRGSLRARKSNRAGDLVVYITLTLILLPCLQRLPGPSAQKR